MRALAPSFFFAAVSLPRLARKKTTSAAPLVNTRHMLQKQRYFRLSSAAAAAAVAMQSKRPLDRLAHVLFLVGAAALNKREKERGKMAESRKEKTEIILTAAKCGRRARVYVRVVAW